jgi:hypothetical protein
LLAVDLMMFAGVEHALHTAGLVGMVLHYTLVCLINIGVIPLNASTMNREFFCYDKLTQTSVHKCRMACVKVQFKNASYVASF